MNIGIDAKRLFFNSSGLGNYSRRFCNALASQLSPHDTHFTLYSPKKIPPSHHFLKEIHFNNYSIATPYSPLMRSFGGALWRSWGMRQQWKHDQIQIYYGLSNELPFGEPQTDIREAAIIHDLIFLRFPHLYPRGDVFFYRHKTQFACRRAHALIAASEQTRRDILTFYPDTPPEKITVIPPACDATFYDTDNNTSAPAFAALPPRFVLSVGAITPRKNTAQSVEAFARIADTFGDLHLLLVGKTVGMGVPYQEKIKAYIQSHHLQQRVHWLPAVGNATLPFLYRRAEAVLYPSQTEGFGMPIVEALASGTAVITTAGGCFEEAGGEAAVYVQNPNNAREIAAALEQLLSTPQLRQQHIIKGKAHAQLFTPENIARRIGAFHQVFVNG